MAAKPFVFNNVKKELWNVSLKDGTKLILTPPSGFTLNSVNSLERETSFNPAALYEMMAVILSDNKQGVEIDRDMLMKNYDLIDVNAFIEAWYEYVGEVQNQKN